MFRVPRLSHQFRSQIHLYMVNITSLHFIQVNTWYSSNISSQTKNFCIYRFQDLTVDQFREIRAKAGGLILLLPKNLSELTAEQRQVSTNIMKKICCVLNIDVKKINKHNWIGGFTQNSTNLIRNKFIQCFYIYCSHLQHVSNLEQTMLAQEISIPVYFSNYDTELDEIIEDISKIKSDEPDDVADIKAAGKRDSALSEIVNSISANGYQVSI